MAIKNTIGIIALTFVLTLGAIACTQDSPEVDDVTRNEDATQDLATTEEPAATEAAEATSLEAPETHEVGSGSIPAELPATGAPAAPEVIQSNVEAVPYDNEPAVTGVPCAVATCRDAQGRSNAELQNEWTAAHPKPATPGPFKTEAEAEAYWKAAGRPVAGAR